MSHLDVAFGVLNYRAVLHQVRLPHAVFEIERLSRPATILRECVNLLLVRVVVAHQVVLLMLPVPAMVVSNLIWVSCIARFLLVDRIIEAPLLIRHDHAR